MRRRTPSESEPRHRVLVVGGGFGGLYAAKALRRAPVEVTLVDRANRHLFQPLLYQVSAGILAESEIAPPLRGILRRRANIELAGQIAELSRGILPPDYRAIDTAAARISVLEAGPALLEGWPDGLSRRGEREISTPERAPEPAHEAVAS